MHIKGFKHTGNGPKYVKNFFTGGKVTRGPMPESGNALVQRSKPVTDEDRVGGGKTPLRSGFAKGGSPKKWMQEAVKRPGALHQALHVPQGEKIPAKKLAKAAHSDNPHMRQMVNFAKVAKKVNRAKGGSVHSDVAQDRALISSELKKHHLIKKADGGRVGTMAQALKAAQSLMSRGMEADKAAVKAAQVHGVDQKALSDSLMKSGLKPNPQMLSHGGRTRKSYGGFNRTPRIQC